MVDAEVMRLRHLRDVALRVRATIRALRAGVQEGSVADELLSRSAVGCWRVAGIATGRLRSHPQLRYQRGHGLWQDFADALAATIATRAARRRGCTLQLFAAELHRMARELQDTRALTWAPELSDTLGRAQVQLSKLVSSVDAMARTQSRPAQGARLTPATQTGGDWPYLAI